MTLSFFLFFFTKAKVWGHWPAWALCCHSCHGIWKRSNNMQLLGLRKGRLGKEWRWETSLLSPVLLNRPGKRQTSLVLLIATVQPHSAALLTFLTCLYHALLELSSWLQTSQYQTAASNKFLEFLKGFKRNLLNIKQNVERVITSDVFKY